MNVRYFIELEWQQEWKLTASNLESNNDSSRSLAGLKLTIRMYGDYWERQEAHQGMEHHQ